MEGLVNRHWRLRSRPNGMVRDSDFAWSEAPVSPPQDGEILVRVDWLSFDPAQRTYLDGQKSYAKPVEVGEVMRAVGVGEVMQSRAPGFAPGDLVQGSFGWQEYATLNPGAGMIPVAKLRPGVDPRTALGLLGVSGLTAYFGMTRVAGVRSGHTVVVSGAAGATGSVAGQVARIAGARVIGIAGGEEKCRWLTETANFDAAIDYRRDDIAARLAALAPDGVDVFFDNVGGRVLESVIGQLALNATVALCGAISGYNERQEGPANLINLAYTRSKIEGFLLLDYIPEFPEAISNLSQWAQEGRIVVQVDVQRDLMNAPATLRRLFEGKNLGKQLLQL